MPGAICSQPFFHLIDIMPTLCELAGAKYPETYKGRAIPPAEGVSLLPYIENPGRPAEKRAIFWQHENHSAVREGDWKLVTVDDRSPARWELYDLRLDRSEAEDLARARPEIVRSLAGKWRAWARRVGALPFPEARRTTGARAPAKR